MSTSHSRKKSSSYSKKTAVPALTYTYGESDSDNDLDNDKEKDVLELVQGLDEDDMLGTIHYTFDWYHIGINWYYKMHM